jgi:hypothetical protein
MCVLDPAQRIKMEGVLHHPWFVTGTCIDPEVLRPHLQQLYWRHALLETLMLRAKHRCVAALSVTIDGN